MASDNFGVFERVHPVSGERQQRTAGTRAEAVKLRFSGWREQTQTGDARSGAAVAGGVPSAGQPTAQPAPPATPAMPPTEPAVKPAKPSSKSV